MVEGETQAVVVETDEVEELDHMDEGMRWTRCRASWTRITRWRKR